MNLQHNSIGQALLKPIRLQDFKLESLAAHLPTVRTLQFFRLTMDSHF